MSNWNYDPSQYQEKDYSVIPQGDYRMRISDVVYKTFKSGNSGYEITMDVSGFNSRLWHYLVLDASDPAKTNQKIGEFFNSFGITNYNMESGKQWIGLVGAGRVKHVQYNGKTQAKIAYLIGRDRQEKLAPWKEPSLSANASVAPTTVPNDTVELPTDLPFDMA